MAKGEKTGGRVKGVPNKLTTGAKEVIAQVAENIGGVARNDGVSAKGSRERTSVLDEHLREVASIAGSCDGENRNVTLKVIHPWKEKRTERRVAVVV